MLKCPSCDGKDITFLYPSFKATKPGKTLTCRTCEKEIPVNRDFEALIEQLWESGRGAKLQEILEALKP